MTTQTRPQPRSLSNEWILYRTVVWTELTVFCLLVWRAAILLALALVR
jgi:hypothetical protein